MIPEGHEVEWFDYGDSFLRCSSCGRLDRRKRCKGEADHKWEGASVGWDETAHTCITGEACFDCGKTRHPEMEKRGKWIKRY